MGDLAKEVRLGRVVGPMDVGGYQRVQVNRFGLVAKNHQAVAPHSGPFLPSGFERKRRGGT